MKQWGGSRSNGHLWAGMGESVAPGCAALIFWDRRLVCRAGVLVQ